MFGGLSHHLHLQASSATATAYSSSHVDDSSANTKIHVSNMLGDNTIVNTAAYIDSSQQPALGMEQPNDVHEDSTRELDMLEPYVGHNLNQETALFKSPINLEPLEQYTAQLAPISLDASLASPSGALITHISVEDLYVPKQYQAL
ncbi:hypothetical protein GH714_003171 [Hevea brasiliensis]|uniref:Uncharacterized protein n=1 Tax=Hevea brasiliensis TaxID=3981 RepID=A0A6A6L1P4_HEVBR|nr:hypothetical protein GH714_003171 [Hevea brasiliensis]